MISTAWYLVAFITLAHFDFRWGVPTRGSGEKQTGMSLDLKFVKLTADVLEN